MKRFRVVEPDLYGAYYAACDADCTDPASWSQTRIAMNTPYDAEVFKYPSLTFTRSGQPRIVADVITLADDEVGIYYVGCDANCDDTDSWGRVYLFERASGVTTSWDIALDSADRPRIIFYKGETLGVHLRFAQASDL